MFSQCCPCTVAVINTKYNVLSVSVLQPSEMMLNTPQNIGVSKPISNLTLIQNNVNSMVTAAFNICGCLVIVTLPLTVVTNCRLPATVGVHQMMCEITKCVG